MNRQREMTSTSPAGSIRRSLWLVGAVLAALAWPSLAQAQVIVVQSTAKSIKPGAMLNNDDKVSIPKGAKAMFVLPSGATRTVSGPFEGLASELTKGIKHNPGLFDQVKRYVQTGGSSSATVGATRGFSPPPVSRGTLSGNRSRRLFSWREIPLTATGDYCIEKGVKVSLVRPRSGKSSTLTIIDMKTRLRVQATFPDGARTIPWPEDLDLTPNATYALLANGQPMRQIRLRAITPLPPREETLQVLHHQRCNSQFRAFIREIQTASK